MPWLRVPAWHIRNAPIEALPAQDTQFDFSQFPEGTRASSHAPAWNTIPTSRAIRRACAFVLTPGQRHEATAFEQLMEQGAVTWPERGRPRLRPRSVVGDKGYRSRKIREYL